MIEGEHEQAGDGHEGGAAQDSSQRGSQPVLAPQCRDDRLMVGVVDVLAPENIPAGTAIVLPPEPAQAAWLSDSSTLSRLAAVTCSRASVSPF